MSDLYGSDAYSLVEIARRIESVGEAKARMAALPLALLGVLAGAFIGLGAMLSVLVKSDPTLGFATSAVLGGLVFAMGLLMVVVAGAELFTGNNLIVMAWADGRVSTAQLLRNWTIVCLANFVGAAGLALLVWARHLVWKVCWRCKKQTMPSSASTRSSRAKSVHSCCTASCTSTGRQVTSWCLTTVTTSYRKTLA